MPEPLSRREASRRTTAVAAPAAPAGPQLGPLPSAPRRGRHGAALAALPAAGAARVALALVTARTASARPAWRAACALGAAVVAGWVGTRLIPVPAVAQSAGRWTSPPGLASATLCAGVLALGLRAAGPLPAARAVRVLGASAAICAALAPAAAVFAIGAGPAPGGARAAGHAGAHAVAAVSHAPVRAFRPGFGGHAGHYVYANAAPPHLP